MSDNILSTSTFYLPWVEAFKVVIREQYILVRVPDPSVKKIMPVRKI
jgi:hypothetical protein